MYETKLRYFLCAARRLSFTKAAEDCHVTQSTISKQISALEEEMGAALFSRHRNTLKLTAAGELLAGKAAACIEQYEKINRSVLSLEKSGELTISAGGWEWLLIARPLAGFRAENPAVPIRSVHPAKHELEEQVRAGSVKAAIVRCPIRGSGLRVTPIGHSSWVVCAASGSSFWSLPPSERGVFKDHTIIALPGDLNGIIKPYCASSAAEQAGFNVCGSVTPLLTMVRAGVGVALVPGFAAQTLPAGISWEKLPGRALTSAYAAITPHEPRGTAADSFAAACAHVFGTPSGVPSGDSEIDIQNINWEELN